PSSARFIPVRACIAKEAPPKTIANSKTFHKPNEDGVTVANVTAPLAAKRSHSFGNVRPFRLCHPSIERQAQQTVGNSLGDRTIALASAEAQTHRREMQRQIMKDGRDAVLRQMPC